MPKENKNKKKNTNSTQKNQSNTKNSETTKKSSITMPKFDFNALIKDIKKIKWASWSGKDGLFARFIKVLCFSGALLAFFTVCNFLISLVWRAL